jgi:hypothetical protein
MRQNIFWVAAVLVFASIAHGQTCPKGTEPASWGITKDQVTGEVRQLACVDARGRLALTTQTLNSIRFANQFDTIQAAVDDLPANGGTVFIPAGTYTTGTITLPLTPKVVNLIGAGMQSTVLQANAPNIPIIKGGAYPTESARNVIGGFSVKAHASGSTASAIEMAGCRACVFHDIEYLSNGSANFASFFHFASYADGGPSHCYGNVVRHPVVHAQTGPATVFLFDNGGTGSPNYQANANEIQDIWIYYNYGITTVIDALRSALTKISGGVVERNSGAVVLVPGTNTIFENIWMEGNAAFPVVPTRGTDGSSNGVKFLNNYISTPFTLTLPPSIHDWLIAGNYPPANLTVMNSGSRNTLQSGSVSGVREAAADVIQDNSGSGDQYWARLFHTVGGAYPGSPIITGEADNVDGLETGPLLNLSRTPALEGLALRPVLLGEEVPETAAPSLANALQSTTRLTNTKAGVIDSSVPADTGALIVASTKPLADFPTQRPESRIILAGLSRERGSLRHARVPIKFCEKMGCTVTVAWEPAFVDANYTPTCTLSDAAPLSKSAGLRLGKIRTQGASSIGVDIDNLGASPAGGTLNCIAVHD